MAHPNIEQARQREAIVLAAMTAAANAGKVCPSTAQLANLTGVRRKRVYPIIQRLVRAGEITILHRRSPLVVLVHSIGAPTADLAEQRIFQIAEVVARVASLPVEDILGRSRLKLYTRPRFLVYHFAHRQGFGAARIGRVVGRDHTSILHALRTFKDRLKTDPLFARLHRRIEAALDGTDLTLVSFTPRLLRAPARPPQRARFEIGEDGELQPMVPAPAPRFDPMLAALRVAHPERFAA